MVRLQPKRKSFENYVRLGYEYNFKKMSSVQVKILMNLSSIDEGVLIMDDIFDKSNMRNGKACHYKRVGIQQAISDAEILRVNAVKQLIQLMKLSKTSEPNQILVLERINEFFGGIYLGEKMDDEIESQKFNPDLLKKYFKMVKLFTGGHVRHGLEIGQLLSNKKIDNNLGRIATSLGVIRQIVDDFNDYFGEPHEPFNDFLTDSNRLPHLLFKKNKGDKTKVLRYLKKKQFLKARDLAVSDDIRNELYEYCRKELAKCRKIRTDFDYSYLIEDFESILTRQK